MFLKNFKIGQKLFLGFGIVIMLMIGLLGYIYINFDKQSKAIDLNIKSYNVIRMSDQILISLINMETGSRGFAITGKEEFLEPFNIGMSEYNLQFSELKALTSGNSLQKESLIKIQNDFDAWFKYQSNNIIEARRKVNTGQFSMEDLVSEAQKGIAKQYMDNTRVSLNDITKEEQRLLEVRKSSLESMKRLTLFVILFGGIIVAVLAIIIAFLVIRMIVGPVTTVTNTFREISQGDVNLEVRMNVNSKDELGSMAEYFNLFMCKLRELISENRKQSWLKAGQAELNEKMRGELDIQVLTANIITFMTQYVDAQIGVLYIRTDNDTFVMSGSYAYKNQKKFPDEIKLGEGIVGQVALEKQSILLTNVPKDYFSICTGIGEGVPRNILIAPCINNDQVVGILELGSFKDFTNEHLHFIKQVNESIAIGINTVQSRARMRELLNKTLEQSEELQVQQEELRQNNEELEEQTKALKQSEAFMQSQQEELRVINEELEERTKSLEHQKQDIISKNQRLQQAQGEIEQKAKALEIASKYKSEFLANMSHELRTPLNSIIVLSQMLAENKESSTLTDKQLQFANTIHSSGEDLLKLINDILDLSKVEAGKLDINFEDVYLQQLAQYAKRSFGPIAEKNGLSFNIVIEEGTPAKIVSDPHRLQQIINNLLSNAFKFTHQGQITLSIGLVKDIKDSKRLLYLSVKDTGIGISSDKREIIFEAFKQSDGTTSRKYGGTGLGLSISRELAQLMGGTIKLESTEGIGSTFSLILPENKEAKNNLLTEENESINRKQDISEFKAIHEEITMRSKDMVTESKFKEYGESVKSSDKVLLIIEDDREFSNILCELAEDRGYKCIVARGGKEGVDLAKQFKPHAVLLDIDLPDISGWMVVDHINKDSVTSSIPVHIISGMETNEFFKKAEEIVGYMQKPASLEKLDQVFSKIESVIPVEFKKLLIINENMDDDIVTLIANKGIKVTILDSGTEVLNLLENEEFDCMILDFKLADMSTLDLLKRLKEYKLLNLPIIIYTDKELTKEDDDELQKYADSIIIKGHRSMDRLIAEASLFLHDVDSKLEKAKINVIKSSVEKEDCFKEKKILIVDDDMRNVFVLTSILEEKGLRVIMGRNGREGIQKLQEEQNIDLVLMDIMMPEMDGYAAIREIRKGAKFSKVPIIAITAKAMKEDRQKCIEAGADDYLIKPIDIARLISLLRVWLYK